MSDTNRSILRYVAESTIGTTPSTPTMKLLRFTGESLTHSTSFQASGEVRSDGQLADNIRTGVSAAGDIKFELSYGMPDDFLASMLRSAWGSDLGISDNDIVATATGGKFVSSTVDFSTVPVGMWVKVAGFVSNAVNNGWFLVESVTSTDLVVSGATLINETPGSGVTITISGSLLQNGTTKSSYSIEKEFEDVNKFDSFLGMRVGTFSLDVPTEGIITGAFGFSGFKGADSQSATLANSNTAAPTNDVMNSIDHVSSIREGGTVLTQDVVSLGFSITTNPRGLPAVGNLGPVDVSTGALILTGSFHLYFEDRTHVDLARAWTETSFSFKTEDDAGNAYYWSIPAIRINSDPFNISGGDQDVIAEFGFAAQIDDGSGGSNKTINVTRLAA